MEAFAPTACRHTRIRVKTEHPTDFVDLTDQLTALVLESGIQTGIVNVQSLHTTTAIMVNENEPLLLGDFGVMLEIIAPSNLPYRHDDLAARTVNVVADERVNGHAHCRAVLLGLSACINVIDGQLQLGAWQRVFFAELDGPRDREISVLILGGGGGQ